MKYFLILITLFIVLRVNASEISSPIQEDPEVVEVVEEVIPEISYELPVDSVIDIGLPVYPDWNVATLQGKFKMQGLPMSPTLKIFMQKDSLIVVSVRVLLMGEVVRIEFTPDSVLMINKMKKTYVKADLKTLNQYYPGNIGDIQDLLLARFFLPGFDIENDGLENLINIVYEDGDIYVLPDGDALIPGITYGYQIDETFKLQSIVVMPSGAPDMSIEANYKYGLRGYDINLSYTDEKNKMDVTFELDNPEWRGEAPGAIDLSKKYRQVSFQEMIHNFY